MKRLAVRVVRNAAALLCLALCLGITPGGWAATRTGQVPANRQQLIGAWRLVSVQIIGPDGARNDPFYNANPDGMLVYDASGWMSVQIESRPRPSMDAPASRSGGPHSAEEAQRDASVLDTYYAYVATWDYDKATSKVTHHVQVSLIPAETGKSYVQTVHLDGGELIFTSPRPDLGEATRQEKIWKRVDSRSE